ncbi:hypothetical protein K8I85_10380, partial [bacterium]|nr:hypothetical protein [bacterium]
TESTGPGPNGGATCRRRIATSSAASWRAGSHELPVPAELERIVLDCLAKVPEDRPRSAAELARRLAQCGPETTWDEERAREWWDVHLPRKDTPAGWDDGAAEERTAGLA